MTALRPHAFEGLLAPPGGAWQQARDIHDRWLRELVEDLGICPFARKSREQGRVHRVVFHGAGTPPTAVLVADAIANTFATHPSTEIVLPTFLVEPGHPWHELRCFESFVVQVREAYAPIAAGRDAYMVAFHPKFLPLPEERTTADNLVPLLRRTPDPVIQVVDAMVLAKLRVATQQRARERLLQDLAALEPAVAALLRNSVQTDAELGEDIARHNFKTVGRGEGRRDYELKLAALIAERAKLEAALASARATLLHMER